MLKKTITYTDFNDIACEDTLYFNISKTKLLDNLDLEDQLRDIQKSFEGPSRDLTPTEVRSIINLVKRIMRLAYGVRSADGKHFNQKPEIWDSFEDTAAYDAFLLSLFQNPDEAYAFILGVIPQDFRAQAEAEAKALQAAPAVVVPDEPVETPKTEVGITVEDNRPAWEREDRDPTDDELRSMTPAQMRTAFVRKAAKA